MENLRFAAAVLGMFLLLGTYSVYIYTTGIGSKEAQEARKNAGK